MTRLGFLSPDEVAEGVALGSPLVGVDLGGIVEEMRELRKIEIRGDVEAYEPAAGERLIPLGPGRALAVVEGPAATTRDRVAAAGLRAYDLTAGLTALEFDGTDLLARLTDLDPGSLPATGSVARGTPSLVESRGGERYRLYVPRELARFVAEVAVDLARGLGR